ncbi:MAG: hypothetical protein AB8G11_15520 [Saprospiraceae bacterium]
MVGTTDANGNVTFPSDVFALAGLQTLYTCYGSEFIVEVSNVSGNCTAVIPTIDSVNITFTVNTNKSGFTVDATGIFLTGGGNFGLSGDNSMTDSDNNDDRTLPVVYNDTTLSTCFAEYFSDGTCATNTTRLTNDETLFSVAPTLVNNYIMITFGETVMNTEKTIHFLNTVG